MSFFHSSLHKVKFPLLVMITLILVSLIGISAIAFAKNTTNIPKYSGSIPADVIIDKVYVDKSERVLNLLSNNKVIKSYHIALGDSPVGHKHQQGDERTPTGHYTLDYKNEKSGYHRSIHVSYPNAAEQAQARKRGVSPGGDIMIHGQKNGFGHLAALTQQRDWTDGCIAVTDKAMDEIMSIYKAGMLIEIVE